MLELGSYSKKLHESIAPLINQTKIDKVFVKGKMASLIYKKISNSKKGKILINNYINSMSSIIKKLFGTLLEKPWEESQALIDNNHEGKTFGITNQMSAVIIIFGISTAIFSLIFTAYLYSIPPEQDTTLILKNKLFIYFFIYKRHHIFIKRWTNVFIIFI